MFKIRRVYPGGSVAWSRGAIQKRLVYTEKGKYHYESHVEWSTAKGKVWKTEALLKAHLLKAVLAGIDTSTWEVIEVIEQPTKPINDWFDANMLKKILKGQGTKK